MEDAFEINDLVEPKKQEGWRPHERVGVVLEIQPDFYQRPVRSGNHLNGTNLVDRIMVLWCNGDVCYEPAIYLAKVMNKTHQGD